MMRYQSTRKERELIILSFVALLILVSGQYGEIREEEDTHKRSAVDTAHMMEARIMQSAFAALEVPCVNNDDWIFSQDAFIHCEELSHKTFQERMGLCLLEEVYTNCPVTCCVCHEDEPGVMFPSTPTFQPSVILSKSPTSGPPKMLTNTPSEQSSSQAPSLLPSEILTEKTTSSPSGDSPSSSPSSVPSIGPTLFPTSIPTMSPITYPPTNVPSTTPSSPPTVFPFASPSISPTLAPSSSPTLSPTAPPTPSPSILPTVAPTSKKPNLVMIVTDEHNLRTLSCYRDYLVSRLGADNVDVWGEMTRLETPHIDALAREGALYTNYYTVAPLCTPSRASFMTGLYPAFTGDSDLNHGAMDVNLKTFAAVLQKEKEYHTGYFGKWHLDGTPQPGWGDNGRKFGFDENKYRWNRGHFKFIDEVGGNLQGYEITDAGRFRGKENKHYTTDYVVDRGIEFINKSAAKDEPFAVVISIPDPHGPNQNRFWYRNTYKDRHFKVPNTVKTALSYNPAAPDIDFWLIEKVPFDEIDDYIEQYETSKKWQNHMQQYYGMVKCIDFNIGKLMGAIKKAGIDEDTIVVFTSDHGDMLLEHGKFNKGAPFETSAGIPFIIRHPEKIRRGKIVETAYSSVDFFPTILSLMGVRDVNIDVHGVDGSEELLNDDMISYDEGKIIFSMDSSKTPVWASAQMGHYKLVVSKNDIPWLFDVRRDPEEIYNFVEFATHTKVKRRLQDAIVGALFEYEMPVLGFATTIYIDKPACIDKRDALGLGQGNLCSDIGGKVNPNECSNKQAVRNHCPVTCESCCDDTDGRIIVDGYLYTSCSDLKDKCHIRNVQIFCPVTCHKCKK